MEKNQCILLFSRTIHTFKGNFTKFQDNSRTNGTILKFQEFSRTKVKFKDFSRSVRTLKVIRVSGKRWSSDSGLTNQKARLDHVTSAETTCSVVEDGEMEVQDLFLARLSESVGRHAATPAGLRGSFKSQPRQA